MSAPHISRIEWQGIGIELRYVQNCYGSESDHIELRVDGKQRLPITNTGYRSHFIHNDAIAQFGSVEAYILAWLDHEAQSPSWRTYVERPRQLSLF